MKKEIDGKISDELKPQITFLGFNAPAAGDSDLQMFGQTKQQIYMLGNCATARKKGSS